MNFIKPLAIAGLATMGVAAAIAPAQAGLTLTGLDCSASTFTVAGGTYLGCSGAWSGNDSTQTSYILDELSTKFGGTNWTFNDADKSDAAGSGVFTSNPTVTAGTLTFDNPIKGKFAISLKAANSFSLFGVDGGTTGVTSIQFTTDGVSTNDKGKPQALSHASFYALNDPATSEPVPEPLTILGSVAAVGIGYGLKRRRAAQDT